MKKLIFAAALMMSGAALAQQTPPAEQMPPPAPDAAQTPMPEAPPVPDPTQTPMPPPPPADSSTAAPPAGEAKQFGTPPTVEQKYPAPAPKAEYPWCSKTVTDGCKQRRSPK
ncbi:hypothetical protein [Sphingomonas cavernae]|uniref:hypothetical protein n=1 Tax=Sphingomonas cavernae TaxID=2320861 RepID=UPI0011C3B91B|nr:hypothetical protein [Sphingomonas cavernae]